jgi:hypothetical protein
MWTCGIPSDSEALFVGDPGVDEASAVNVDATVGILVSLGETGFTAGGTFVGSGTPVGSTTGTVAGAQAVRRRKATTTIFIIEDNYM